MSLLYKRVFSTQITSPRPFKNKHTLDLINSYIVFKLCGFPKLVELTPTIIQASKKLGMSSPLYSVIKVTFFRHFCGGENLKEVLPTIESFKSSGIGSILDLAMEADLEDGVDISRETAVQQAHKISQMMKESVDIASKQPGNFIAAKVTAFVPPSILMNWTDNLNLARKSFTKVCNDQGKMSYDDFLKLSTEFPLLKGSDAQRAFDLADSDKDDKIDWVDFFTAFSIWNPSTSSLLVTPSCKTSKEDLETASLVLKELQDLCHYAKQSKVRLMIDAEQTYFQSAIDDIALGLCGQFNEQLSNQNASLKYALVYNTYQLYLKGSLERLKLDVERASRFNYAFGVKIVRGAYMVSERERASGLHIPDPINSTIQDTHANFNNAINYLAAEISRIEKQTLVQPLRFVVASHNKDSIQVAVDAMKRYNIEPSDGTVAFAQLMGMQDAVTCGLASLGIKVYKYIPYGPIAVTIPYLHRRAIENSSMLGGAEEDKKNLLLEIKKRFKE